jgi:AraC family transcriptional regulator, regulatory protein of adaptative response / methylated-DNA-[protein]-cysteine methyltransferase
MESMNTEVPEAVADMSHTMDYDRVARAIAYLHRHADTQPELAAVARHVDLSEFHFQRLFLRWAGVSPKRFLQHLTLENAKARLSGSRNLLEATEELGLSGPGRLHDLFVTLEAMSPGEYKSGGAGLDISFGVHESPFGWALIASTTRGICALRFIERATERTAEDLLREVWAKARMKLDRVRVRELGARIFDPLSAPANKPLALLVKGTNFQLQVWRALLQLPLGALATYGEIAGRIGRPAAARAVGAAIGANPIAYLIPCHRVIRESGHLGGYRWGEARKAAILGREAAHGEGATEHKSPVTSHTL